MRHRQQLAGAVHAEREPAFLELAVASVDRRCAAEGIASDEGLTDDAGLTRFEREHLRKIILGEFVSHSDSRLRKLARKTQIHMLACVISALFIAGMLTLLSSPHLCAA